MKATDRLPSSRRGLALVLTSWLLGAALSLAQQAAPSKVFVADVIIQPPGDCGLPSGKLMNIIKTRVGNEFSQATLDEDVRQLWQTKVFANVVATKDSVGPDKIKVIFWLTPQPSIVQDIVFDGIKHIKQEELDTICSNAGLRKSGRLSPVAVEMVRQAILKKYQEDGRMFSSVQVLEGNRPGDTRVVFSVTEGAVIRVASIQFTGNDFVPDGRIRSQLNTSIAIFHVLGGKFVPGMVDNDVSILEKYYKTYGFQDCFVQRELVWSDDHCEVTIIFHIHQGQRYRIGNVQLAGNKTYDENRLLDLLRTKPNSYYDQNLIHADEESITRYYGYDGRQVTVKEEPSVATNGTPGVVNVTYEIIERPPATVGQIIVVGNTITKDNIILRQLKVYPGQVLTYPDLAISTANLTRLNIFNVDQEKGIKPTVSVLDEDSDNPVKDVLVNVEETRTGSLMFGVGVNSDAGLTGSIVLNERNFDIERPPTSFDDLLSGAAFRGAGQEFKIEAVPGTEVQRYSASWREPYLFDGPYSLTVSPYYYERIYNEDLESRTGGRVTLARKLDDYWSVSASLRLEGVGIHDLAFYAPYPYSSVEGTSFLAGLRVGFTRDTRDSYLRATDGSMFTVSYEQVTGDFTFPVFSVEANKYFTLWERADNSGRHALALRSQLGICGANAPVFERFYAGGFESMRGFEFRGVGPDIYGYKVGGDFMWLNSIEYQIPILPNDQLYGVVFVDSGDVESKVDLSTYRVAAGFGVRIVVPMLGPVPIALDFGFPLVQAQSDVKQVFSFWLGFFH